MAVPKREIAPQESIDAIGLRCPEPVMLLHAAMRRLESGQELTLRATDPSTERDVPNFCEFLGHALLVARREGDEEKDGTLRLLARPPWPVPRPSLLGPGARGLAQHRLGAEAQCHRAPEAVRLALEARRVTEAAPQARRAEAVRGLPAEHRLDALEARGRAEELLAPDPLGSEAHLRAGRGAALERDDPAAA